MPNESTPHIEYLRVENFRALGNLELKNLTPLTVFLGPNGSGKSTVFDVFAFLSECFTDGLIRAWDRRGRFKALRTQGAEGPIVIEFIYREKTNKSPIMTYHLSINENTSGPFIEEERLQLRSRPKGKPTEILHFKNGTGWAKTGEIPDEADTPVFEELASPDMLAVNTLGRLAKHHRMNVLRRFIAGWHLSNLSLESMKNITAAGPQEHLSPIGDNLPNVVLFLKERHKDILAGILEILTRHVPRLQWLDTAAPGDGRLSLQIKDAPFPGPIQAVYASDGTLKLLCYLIILYHPQPPPLTCIEEPENHLHPRLLPVLAEECRMASRKSQFFVTTHSPYFVNGLQSKELKILYRDDKGYSQAVGADTIEGVPEFIKHGAQLGYLWLEGHFGVGDPLSFSGGLQPGVRIDNTGKRDILE